MNVLQTAAGSPFVPQDIWRLSAITDPVIHPAGTRIAYVVRTADPERNTYCSAIRLAEWDGSREWTATTDGFDADAPIWSPDGAALLFLSRRFGHERRQICLLPSDMGEARCLTTIDGGIATASWSPDSRLIAFLAFIDPVPARPDALADDVELIDRVVWREDGFGSFTHRRLHLFVMNRDGTDLRRLTDGHFSVRQFCFAPDGNRIFYIATPDPEDDRAAALQTEIFAVDCDGGAVQQITNCGGAFSALKALNEHALLAIGSDLEYGEASPSLLRQIELPSGTVRNLMPSFDRSIGDSLFCDIRVPSRSHDPWIASDGGSARMRVTDGGAVRLAHVDLRSGSVEWLTPADLSVLAWHATADGRRRVELRTTMIDPPELWAIEGDQAPRRLTRLNDELVEQRMLVAPRSVSFTASDGVPIEAWIIRPEHDSSAALPVVIAVHGGPKRGIYGHAFMLEFHMLAAAGMAVAYCNYRGSDGYGTAFVRAIQGRRIDRDALDQSEFIEHLFAVEHGLDPQRIAVNGGGYGGFLSNWLISQDQRFKAAISQRSISDWSSLYGASPIGFHMVPEHLGCLPWEDPEHYRRKSPLSYAAQIRTPLLLIHGEQDLRCTIEQAEQLFTALRRLGRTVRLARFPGAGHAMTRTGTPRHRAENLRLILEWLKAHL